MSATHLPADAPSAKFRSDERDDYAFLPLMFKLIGRSVRHYWWYIPVAITASILVALALLRNSPSIYEAKMTFTQRQSSASNLSEVSSLAQSFGIGRATTSATETMEIYTALLTDPSLAQYLADHDPTFLPLLFPGQWERKTKKWHAEGGILQNLKALIKEAAGFQAWTPPNAETASNVVQGLLQITDARQTGFRTIEIDDPNRQRALTLLRMLSTGADTLVRKRELEQSERRVKYLRTQLSTATDLSLRDALSQLLEKEERNLMLTRIDRYYAIRIVSPPQVYVTPPGKRIKTALLLSIVLGTLLGVALAFFRFTGWRFWVSS